MALRERANIVDSVRMIGMIVRVQHCVDPIDSGCYELHPQLGRRVDEEMCIILCLDERADSRSFVTGIGRPANGTAASHLRNAEARARPEECQSHGRRRPHAC